MIKHTIGDVLLKIEDVSLEYQGRPVLKNVNAEVRDIVGEDHTIGQVVGFLGPSGIGKTQLFRIIAGLNKPTSGHVVIHGSEAAVSPGDVGVVAQNYPLFNHRTVMSNLMLAAMQKEHDKKVAGEKVQEYLNEFDLLDRKDAYPAQLSGGQRQRCAIIQQILCSTHFLLMDEPFSGLDLLMLEKTMRLIEQVAHMHSLNTIIVVTHDVTAACAISDTVWLLGRDDDPANPGKKLPGAHIVKKYDLIERGLAWQPNIITEKRFLDFTSEVKGQFKHL